MRLWTVMERDLYEKTLERDVPYRCDTERCEMLTLDGPHGQYHKAYDWLSEQMARRIGAPRNDDTKYPVWAWHTVRGLRRRPDLRWMEFRNAPKPMVMLEIEIPDGNVLLSDEEVWTCGQLNDAPCFMGRSDEELDAEMDWYYDDKSIPWSEKESFKMSTWDRIFDVSESDNVQATFWELVPENVIKAWHYNENPKI